MASIIRALVALVAVLVSSFAFAAEFKWTNVGGDPCNPKAGCTLEWALKMTEWPTEVKNVLTAAVSGEISKPYPVHVGWKGWMTWGKYSAKFQPNTIAAWTSDHPEPAELWTTDHQGSRYHLIRVAKCKNWGGWVEELPKPVPAPSPAPVNQNPIPALAVDLMPLGPRYIAGCE